MDYYGITNIDGKERRVRVHHEHIKIESHNGSRFIRNFDFYDDDLNENYTTDGYAPDKWTPVGDQLVLGQIYIAVSGVTLPFWYIPENKGEEDAEMS